MADNQLTEDDGDEDIVVIEGEPPVEDEQPEADDEEEDSGDERLGDSEDDSDDEIVNRNRIKRQKRQAVRQRAKERADAELSLLREQNDALLRRVSAIEGNTLANNVSAIDQRLMQVQNEVKQAEMIIARAVEAGNGEDVAAAIRLRDEAQYEASQLWQNKQHVEQVRHQHAKNRRK